VPRFALSSSHSAIMECGKQDWKIQQHLQWEILSWRSDGLSLAILADPAVFTNDHFALTRREKKGKKTHTHTPTHLKRNSLECSCRVSPHYKPMVIFIECKSAVLKLVNWTVSVQAMQLWGVLMLVKDAPPSPPPRRKWYNRPVVYASFCFWIWGRETGATAAERNKFI